MLKDISVTSSVEPHHFGLSTNLMYLCYSVLPAQVSAAPGHLSARQETQTRLGVSFYYIPENKQVWLVKAPHDLCPLVKIWSV